MTKGVMEFFKTPAGLVLIGASLATGGTLGVPKLVGAFTAEAHGSVESPRTEARLQALENQIVAMRSEQNAKLQRLEDRLDRLIERPFASRTTR